MPPGVPGKVENVGRQCIPGPKNDDFVGFLLRRAISSVSVKVGGAVPRGC